eukprot:Clim_evm5s167 gene=Clim_evmTU5s167
MAFLFTNVMHDETYEVNAPFEDVWTTMATPGKWPDAFKPFMAAAELPKGGTRDGQIKDGAVLKFRAASGPEIKAKVFRGQKTSSEGIVEWGAGWDGILKITHGFTIKKKTANVTEIRNKEFTSGILAILTWFLGTYLIHRGNTAWDKAIKRNFGKSQ